MRFSFSLFQFVDVQVEKAAFSISSVTVITLQIVHFIFLLVNTPLQNLPFFCFDVFSCGKKSNCWSFPSFILHRTEVGGIPAVQLVQMHAADYDRDQSLQSLSTNFSVVDNCQLSTVQLWSIFKLGHTLWHVYCFRWHCLQKEKAQWVILTKETRPNIHLTHIHNCLFKIKADCTIYFSHQ